jgi:hypothetical protein
VQYFPLTGTALRLAIQLAVFHALMIALVAVAATAAASSFITTIGNLTPPTVGLIPLLIRADLLRG